MANFEKFTLNHLRAYLQIKTKFSFPESVQTSAKKKQQDKPTMTLLEAAANVANSLDEAVEKVIKSSPRAKRRELNPGDVMSVIQRQYPTTESTPLLLDDGDEEVEETAASWNDECHKHLTDFADKLSEKLLKEIDQYQEEKRKKESSNVDQLDIDDPYIHRLSEELQDLSKLSAEIQKQNEYLAKLSVNDKMIKLDCGNCNGVKCDCGRTSFLNKFSGKVTGKPTENGKKIIVNNNDVSVKVSELQDVKGEEQAAGIERWRILFYI